MLDAGADLALEAGGVALDVALTPVNGRVARVGQGDGAGESALVVEGEVSNSLHAGVFIALAGGAEEVAAGVGLTDALGKGMLPGQVPVGAEASAGVEKLILTIDADDCDDVVELREGEVGIGEETSITVGDGGGVGLESRSAGHGDEEFGELVVAAAFAGPYVVGVVDLFEALCFLFLGGVLAGVASVLELHDGGIELAQFLIRRVGWDDDVFDGGGDSGAGADELVLRLCPEFALALPEFFGVN